MIFFTWVSNLSYYRLKQDPHGIKAWMSSKETLLLSEPMRAALCFSKDVYFLLNICWIELNPYYLADSGVLWKIQQLQLIVSKICFYLSFEIGEEQYVQSLSSPTFWIIKAKKIEISMCPLFVFGLLACLLVCLLLKSVALHYFIFWMVDQ